MDWLKEEFVGDDEKEEQGFFGVNSDSEDSVNHEESEPSDMD